MSMILQIVNPLYFCTFFPDLSKAQRSFANVLNTFRFECIGEVETDDEILIGRFYILYSIKYIVLNLTFSFFVLFTLSMYFILSLNKKTDVLG